MRTRFLQFTVDTDTRQLLSGGDEIHLSPKALDLLCALLARRPNVVAKEELLAEIWPDSYVSDANLNVLVGEVRKAIGDNAQSPRFIRTVHGAGFAFCGHAIDIEDSPQAPASRTRFWLVGPHGNFVLSEGDNIIGRDPGCNIWLDDADVSRRHARIRIDGAQGIAVLDDLDSTNGTRVGRLKVRPHTRLADGDVIRVGPVELRFRDASDKPRETRRIRRKDH
jgi:DNA-binding winged helix-turn-helix (wHTH) protein